MIDPPTTLDLARDVLWDAIVIGAGPAGSMAAIRLSRDGLKVLLVEKSTPPRDKICGCCLNAVAVNLLEEIGLKSKLLALNAVRIDSLSLRAGASQSELPLTGGLAISRATLDSELIIQAIADGSDFLPGTKALVNEMNTAGSRSVILERDGEQLSVRAKCVLVADGLNGHSLDKLQLLTVKAEDKSRIGAGVRVTDYPVNMFAQGVIYMTCGSGGYVGMVILEDGSLDIAAAFDRSFIQSFKSVGSAANEIVRGTNLSDFDLASLDWHGTPALTRRRQAFSAPALFVIGDAASYAEPFTGEGMAWAFQSATAVIPLVHKVMQSGSGDLDHTEWDKKHERLLAGKQHQSMALAHFLRHPKLVELSLRVLNIFPSLANPVLNSITKVSDRAPDVRNSELPSDPNDHSSSKKLTATVCLKG